MNGTSRGEGCCANPQLTHCGEAEYRRQGCEAGLYIKARLEPAPAYPSAASWGLKRTGLQRLRTTQGLR